MSLASLQDAQDFDRHSLRVGLSVGGAMALAALILGCLILWSTHQADMVTIQRQEQLVATVLRQSTAQIAHDQEASTVWDDAVEHLQVAHPDARWLDANLGVWFHTYYGHDATLIVDGYNRPIYGMWSGKRVAAGELYQRTSAELAPLITQLRHQMAQPKADPDRTVRSPGVTDVALVAGLPVIISVKPIISESGAIAQPPGHEFVHVSIRRLDGSFTQKLADQYGFDGARFLLGLPTPNLGVAVPMRARDGRPVGWIAWQPFRPGTAVLRQVGFALALSLIAMMAIVILLIRRIRRGTIELHASRAHAQHLAFHDKLTGLANRALFDDRLDHELARVRRDGHSTALLYLDLDRFKNVNDSLGHPAGDELIRQVAQRLKGMLRETDTVARLGGDEFAIIQPSIQSLSAAQILCMRIVEELARPFDLGGTTINVGGSIGVAISPRDGHDRVELSRKADIALYSAKSGGKGRYVVFAAAMDESVRRRQEIEVDLRAALVAGDQLKVFYQPLYSARTGHMVGAEALLRWQHPLKGLISPVTFIPIAEETGLIEPLGEWVLHEACTAARDCNLDTISVNVSARQLRNRAFPERVRLLLEQSGLNPRKLELEITETCFMENAADCAASLEHLRDQGVRIALDDFGTGYSSLAQLREISVDRVKIDRSFVNGISSASGSTIIRAIVDMARANGIEVTAEGVETVEQSSFLTGIGCQSLQGFLMSKPMPLHELEDLLGGLHST
jgi:diguanylate cyclase (GGDEF)-like protein